MSDLLLTHSYPLLALLDAISSLALAVPAWLLPVSRQHVRTWRRLRR
jgi:hypothetical protein